ncbi:cobalt-precorrin-8X methylmutase [Oxobacter pfennigii]|uniref:Cobalt-precorrin-8X methylmutase n=1 Tax=Oxobacter pfennigii TaxID=36849 RepID=A0A0P8YZU2_9CLOT|nr:precorrin-8X methylmutase [Oxobacter pfennigii]KPU45404.1 cobalt-precorrin-8X methylmutase [Oxobacter pfennigii]
MYKGDPLDIERRSMEIIDEHVKDTSFNEKELLVVKRMIHTTGDFNYKDIAAFKGNAIEMGIELFKRGCSIFTDTRMAYSGINKKALEKAGCTINCLIDDERVLKKSKELNTTRSSAAIDIASEDGIDIYVIGNAPTALFRIGELMEEGKIKPALVIGVPVGFVGAAESKEYLRGLNVPSISTVGNKGGSNVAASVVNAILYMAVER